MELLELKQKTAYYERITKEVKMKESMKIKTGAEEMIFRASGCGYLMVEPKEKSPKSKWLEACEVTEKLIVDYENIANKESKSCVNKKNAIEKAKEKQSELLTSKDDLHISESTKTHLIDVFLSFHYKRREEINSKFLRKGNECEDDSITLLSRVTKRLYKKNIVRLANQYVTGEWDLSFEEDGKIVETTDTKTSWSAHTFFRAKKDELKKLYFWQGVVYMWLTGAKRHTVAYCLVNGLASAINDEKRKLSFQSGMIDVNGNESESYIEQCKQIEVNHIFDLELFKSHNPYFEFHNDIKQWTYDIPKEKRVFTFTFDRNENDIENLKNRIIDCRKWINKELFEL